MADSTTSLAMGKKEVYKGKKLRVAIIGCGGISQVHLDAYKSIPEVEIVAGCDIVQERLDIMEKTWGVPKKALYKGKNMQDTPWKKMLKEIKPDAVDICTPNGVHCAPAIDAANAGCHVFVEKPMAMSVAQCEKMIAAAKKNKVKLSVGFQRRYQANTDFLVQSKKAGKFGDIVFVDVHALRRRGIPNWGVFGQKELQGGGPMIDIGVHIIEAAHYFMGAPKPVAVTGNIWTYLGDKASKVVCPWPGWDYKTYTVEDLAIGQIRFDNGAIMQIRSAFACHVKHDEQNFTFMGTKGGGSWNPAEIYTDDAGYMVNTTPGYLPPDLESFKTLFIAKLKNWVSGIMNGTELTAPGEAGLMVQKILNGIYDSAAAGGKEVPIK